MADPFLTPQLGAAAINVGTQVGGRLLNSLFGGNPLQKLRDEISATFDARAEREFATRATSAAAGLTGSGLASSGAVGALTPDIRDDVLSQIEEERRRMLLEIDRMEQAQSEQSRMGRLDFITGLAETASATFLATQGGDALTDEIGKLSSLLGEGANLRGQLTNPPSSGAAPIEGQFVNDILSSLGGI